MIKNNCTCDSKGRYNKGEISPKKLWKSEVGKKKNIQEDIIEKEKLQLSKRVMI